MEMPVVVAKTLVLDVATLECIAGIEQLTLDACPAVQEALCLVHPLPDRIAVGLALEEQASVLPCDAHQCDEDVVLRESHLVDVNRCHGTLLGIDAHTSIGRGSLGALPDDR